MQNQESKSKTIEEAQKEIAECEERINKNLKAVQESKSELSMIQGQMLKRVAIHTNALPDEQQRRELQNLSLKLDDIKDQMITVYSDLTGTWLKVLPLIQAVHVSIVKNLENQLKSLESTTKSPQEPPSTFFGKADEKSA